MINTTKFEKQRVQCYYNLSYDDDEPTRHPVSRDYVMGVKCNMTTCRVNRSGKCGMPSACEIDASGTCITGRAFREVIKVEKATLRNPREGD